MRHDLWTGDVRKLDAMNSAGRKGLIPGACRWLESRRSTALWAQFPARRGGFYGLINKSTGPTDRSVFY
jgi:hypothetical protein